MARGATGRSVEKSMKIVLIIDAAKVVVALAILIELFLR